MSVNNTFSTSGDIETSISFLITYWSCPKAMVEALGFDYSPERGLYMTERRHPMINKVNEDG